jgi:hypothetical protein
MNRFFVNLFSASLLGLMLYGCVTINIYFPAAEAQKAADKIIDEVWQTQQQGKEVNTPTNQK